jgi:hypothetical protein
MESGAARFSAERRADNHRIGPHAEPALSAAPVAIRDTFNMLYMVVEHFKNGDAVPVYRRFRERGRMAPIGLTYISSWVTADLTRCFQIMESPNRALLDQWLAQWADLVDFEVLPVITSAEAAASVAPRL